jgi:hypothetical protein
MPQLSTDRNRRMPQDWVAPSSQSKPLAPSQIGAFLLFLRLINPLLRIGFMSANTCSKQCAVQGLVLSHPFNLPTPPMTSKYLTTAYAATDFSFPYCQALRGEDPKQCGITVKRSNP